MQDPTRPVAAARGTCANARVKRSFDCDAGGVRANERETRFDHNSAAILGSGPKVMCLTLPSDRVPEAEYNLTRGTARH
jgi:hypothetical protein